jgi:hypothetical protein
MVSFDINPATGAPNGVSTSPFTLEDYPVDDSTRNMKVAMSEYKLLLVEDMSVPTVELTVPRSTVGAGFAGIIAGIRIDQRLKNIDLSIYEKNSTVGGTW